MQKILQQGEKGGKGAQNTKITTANTTLEWYTLQEITEL